MLDILNEVNNKLTTVITELKEKNIAQDKLVNEVNQKILTKVNEANEYKEKVDQYKSEIDDITAQISDLEKDLKHLKDRFTGKDLDAILDAGEKEINSKIVSKQQEITEKRKSISEFTEKARSIKDLLINLKKDKELKETTLNNYDDALLYYDENLTNIIEYSKENSSNLNKEKDQTINVPDEINEAKPSEEKLEISEEKEEIVKSETKTQDVKKEDITKINSLVNNIPKPTVEEISKTIDKEFENIFGDALESNIFDKEIKLESESENIFDNEKEKPNIKKEEKQVDEIDSSFINEENAKKEDKSFFITEEELNNEVNLFDNIPEPEKDEVSDFFKKFGLDLNKFNSKEELRKNYDEKKYSDILNVLNNHNIDLNTIYENEKLFTLDSTDIDQIITTLLTGGQSVKNINLVMNTIDIVSLSKLKNLMREFNNDLNNLDIADIVMRVKK